jgi:hypothetical protein
VAQRTEKKLTEKNTAYTGSVSVGGLREALAYLDTTRRSS